MPSDPRRDLRDGHPAAGLAASGGGTPAIVPAAFAEARGLGCSYGNGSAAVIALASATCTVRARGRIAVSGPSGSGKSTLLHLLAGLDTPTSGTIAWPALGPSETLRPTKVAFVFQRPSLLAPLSVEENVALPLLLAGADAGMAARSARAILERLELGALAPKLPEELSGGQAQRVAVARALATGARLIFADEPTGQLDRATAGRLLDVLLAAIDGTETALVVATHDATVRARMATIWRMHHGTLEVPASC